LRSAISRALQDLVYQAFEVLYSDGTEARLGLYEPARRARAIDRRPSGPSQSG
jgi:hypothetical protein